MSKDVVYRQAAIEALHEWENLCEWDSWINEHQEQTGSVSPSNVIEQLPSAQPEIVRCKDCKWYGRADKRRFYRGMDCLQKRIDTIIPDKDFCSRAERREE